MTLNSSYDAELESLLSQDIGAADARVAGLYDALAGGKGNRPVFFGAGRVGRVTLAGIRRLGVDPVAFADNNRAAWGTMVDGLAVLSPADAAARFGKDTPFVVTIYTAGSVRRQLRDMGLRVVSFTALYQKYRDAFLPHGCLDRPSLMRPELPEIRAAMELWADDFSRREYLAQVRYRLTLDENLPPFLPPATIYFPDDLVKPMAPERFVDCGAFDGDSVRAFLAHRNHQFGAIHAMEPDPGNAARFGQFIAGLPPEEGARIHVHPCAVGSKRETVHFDAQGTAGSNILAGGKIRVQCESLDGLFAENPPTYIKMDIEGGEPDALRGAAGIIRRHAPVLAICLYHRQNDLWKLPQYIRSLSDRYRLFLRRYSDDCWEQVCYAIPEDRVIPGAVSGG